ncbi:YbhN family protein [uncultured Bosea sp.]|uniref:lysylphosphatidylglycerol synthase transmembrane domain-containing protein n=1 Tax=uncultured Bosea sp. TaxID=211457 RepID=UPI00263ADC1D|nr:YbhN family protein [uncultured Bosea sp.]
MKRYLDYLWPIIGLVAVVWSVELLWSKLKAEAGSDATIEALLADASLWQSIKIIAHRIGHKIAVIPPEAFFHAALATLVAYAALAWYDRIALIHLGKEKGISWPYISLCSFVTYALSHNIGASVFSGGMVRYRAYTAKGLTTAEVAVLVALCSFTFAFGTIFMMGLVLIYEPQILHPLERMSKWFAITDNTARWIGVGMLAFVALYTIGSWLQFKPLKIGKLEIIYPRLPIVFRQYLAAPLELAGAAGIIYFALPDQGNPGFLIVLGAFLLSFSAGLLSQVPGGVGVMEAVFLAVMPTVPAPAVFAALLIWRLFYLILPLVFSLPIVLAFERAQLKRSTRIAPPP